MNKTYKSLVKNMGYLTISNFASKILVFLLVPLYTSVLSTAEYGVYDAIVTTVQFIAPIVIFNISDGVMRFLLEGSKEKEICSIGYRYVSIGITVIGILCVLNSITGLVRFLNGYELFCFLYAAFYILNNHYIQMAKGFNAVSLMAIGGVIGTISMLLANIVFLLIFHWGIYGFFIANIIGQAIPTIFYVIKFRAKFSLVANDSNLTKQILLYSVPLVFNTIGWTINSSLDKYCVIYLCGIEASGLIAVAYKIPTILSVIYAIFTQAWQISAVNEFGKENAKIFYSRTFLTVNALGALCCGGLMLFNRFIARYLFAKDFYQAWIFVPFLLLSAMFNQTAGFVGPLLSAKKDSSAMAKAAVIGSIVNFILNIVLIMTLGVQGAVIATAISSFTIYFVRWWYAKDLLTVEIYPKLYITWLLLLIEAIAEISLSTHAIQSVVLLLLVMINRSSITGIFKAVRKG